MLLHVEVTWHARWNASLICWISFTYLSGKEAIEMFGKGRHIQKPGSFLLITFKVDHSDFFFLLPTEQDGCVEFQTWKLCKPAGCKVGVKDELLICFSNWDVWELTKLTFCGLWQCKNAEKGFRPVWTHLSFLKNWEAGFCLHASQSSDCASSDRRRLSGLRCLRETA